MNSFGGDWTQEKIEILVDYAKAYLVIMNSYWKLMYFDGFAGTGLIVKEKKENTKITIGAALRILGLDDPISFDSYYFVEYEEAKCNKLAALTKEQFPQKEIHTITEDCNKKLKDMAVFLRTPSGKNHKILAYIDPCGMQLEWSSLACLKDLPIDMWILIPTGMGVNRLLKKNGNISDAWMSKLEQFLGISSEEVVTHFYGKSRQMSLFGDEPIKVKEQNAVEKSATLYQERLKTIFNFVSNLYILKNSTNSVMFHYVMVSNNKTAVKIANEIIKKYNNK